MAQSKVPRVIRLLSQFGETALKPKITNGKYEGALIPSRIAANARKRAIVDGTYGKFVPNVGGWDPAWDEPKKMFMLRPFKGHLKDRTRADRAKKIDDAMKAMPDKIKKYEQEIKDRKPKKDIFYLIKKAGELGKKGK